MINLETTNLNKNIIYIFIYIYLPLYFFWCSEIIVLLLTVTSVDEILASTGRKKKIIDRLVCVDEYKCWKNGGCESSVSLLSLSSILSFHPFQDSETTVILCLQGCDPTGNGNV